MANNVTTMQIKQKHKVQSFTSNMISVTLACLSGPDWLVFSISDTADLLGLSGIKILYRMVQKTNEHPVSGIFVGKKKKKTC